MILDLDEGEGGDGRGRVNKVVRLDDIVGRPQALLELATLLRFIGLKPASDDQIHILLADINANDNGSIEFDELGSAIANDVDEQTLVNQDHLLDFFKLFDRDA
ncbi:unnamed protein product [Linum trigynum]|uniref:Calmodulin n=1 Tax=Linum trigynum TaxID=586398 RepID=A0AAV2DN07_9ROSI